MKDSVHLANAESGSVRGHTPGPLTVHSMSSDGQYAINSCTFRREGQWDDIYVNFSGYYGSYGPHVFAAAPELLEACKAQHEALDQLLAMLIEANPTFRPSKSEVWPKLLQGNAAIAKATGAA